MSAEFHENDIPKKIEMTPDGIKKLKEILMDGANGGKIDLIWGPELKLEDNKE